MKLTALFLGYGRMGAALGKAWLSAGLMQHIDAVDPHHTGDAHARIFGNATELPVSRYDLVVLAVKPAIARQALAGLPPACLTQATVLSVMAGVGVTTLERALPQSRPVVRSMPNTAVIVGAGCTGLFGNPLVDEGLRTRITTLFEAVGKAHWVDAEQQLHAVTALSGSGPAYYHLFSEALAEAGVQLGLPRELATQLVAYTALGAARLQTLEGADFASLRRQVTSPNGTTHAAIEVFEQRSALRRLVAQAATEAERRSIALAQH